MKLFFTILLLLPALFMAAGNDTAMEARAARAYSSGDWASAQALYGMVSSRSPGNCLAVARAVSAGLMRSDTTSVVPLIEQALSTGMPLDSLMNTFEDETRALGKADIYEATLHHLVMAMPYLKRPFNARLLAYYRFRQDADRIIEYSEILLSGLPGDVRYLNSLAWGYALKGDMPQALTTWLRATEADPDNFEALSSAGNALIPSDPQRARQLLQRACEIRPTPHLRHLLESLNAQHSRE